MSKKKKPDSQLTIEVKSTTDGRGMVLLVMAGLMTPDHAIELSKFLLAEAVKAKADGEKRGKRG